MLFACLCFGLASASLLDTALAASPWQKSAAPDQPGLEVTSNILPVVEVSADNTKQLNLVYGMQGPASLPELQGQTVDLGNEGFGTIATTSARLYPGMWLFKMRSDDGVRVTVDGKVLLENWTWHGPTINGAVLEVVGSEAKEIVVEHFELDGYATLELQISPMP
ncbi:MAG: hypothetical protein GY879_08595 [Planctomycetes bacterium]|nr:hypothetical protein [Planctomycetota bacterium]